MNKSAQGASSAALWHKDGGNYATVHEGSQLTASGGLATAVIDVSPTGGAAIQLKAHLFDYDPLSANDELGNDLTIDPFETGWRKSSTVLLTGSGSQVRVNFTLAPI